MKKTFILTALLCFFLQTAFAQVHNLFPQEKVMNLPHSRPVEQMEKLRLKNGSWMLDSSWYSQWITSSLSWNLFQREFFQYNSSFQRIEDLFVTWNSTSGQWQNSNRYVTLYTGSGNLTSISGQMWYPAGSLWVTDNYMHFNDQGRIDTTFYKTYNPLTNSFSSGSMNLTFYNSSNMTSELLTQTLDTLSGNWINSILQQYTYNSSNQVSEFLIQQWNTGQNAWVNSNKYDYSYDGSGYATGYINYVWNSTGSQWVQSTQSIYTNNTSGMIMIELDQQWIAATSSWRNKFQISYQYNTGNQLTERLGQNWDTVSSIWVNSTKDQFAFYTNNMFKTHFQWDWNPLTSTWMDTWYSLNDSISGNTLEYYSKTLDLTTYNYQFGYRYVYFYNAASQCTEYDHYDLDIGSDSWTLSGRRLYTYDNNGNNTIQLDQTYDTGTSSWDNYFQLENFYSIATGIKEKPGLSSFCTFANPMRQGETINCANLYPGNDYTLILLSMTGQGILHIDYHAGEPLQLPSGLSTGMYILQIIYHGQLVTSGKVILHE